jgi:Fur family ferric uptake transcriptional regulator
MKNVRLTSARAAILEILDSEQTHLAATQIHESLQERLPSLNISTVYRSLDYLVEHSLVSVTDMGTGTPVYEKLDANPHHHLVCLNCKEFFHLEHNLVTPFFETLEQELSFEVQTNHLVLYGICKHCQSENETLSRKEN